MANRRVVLPLLALAAPLCFTGAWYGAAVPRTVPRSAEAAAPTSGSSVALVKVTKEKLGKEMMVFFRGRATTMMRMRMGLVVMVMVIVTMDGMRMVTAMVKPCPRVFTSKFCSIPFCNVAYLLDIDLMTFCYDPLDRLLWLIPKLLVTPCCRLESQSLSENWFNSNLSAISGTPSPPLASWAESQDFSSVDFGSVLPASWPPPTWPRRQSCGWNCFPRNHGSGKMGPWKTTLISKGAIVCFHVFLEKESIVCVLCLFAWVSCLQWLFILVLLLWDAWVQMAITLSGYPGAVALVNSHHARRMMSPRSWRACPLRLWRRWTMRTTSTKNMHLALQRRDYIEYSIPVLSPTELDQMVVLRVSERERLNVVGFGLSKSKEKGEIW